MIDLTKLRLRGKVDQLETFDDEEEEVNESEAVIEAIGQLTETVREVASRQVEVDTSMIVELLQQISTNQERLLSKRKYKHVVTYGEDGEVVDITSTEV